MADDYRVKSKFNNHNNDPLEKDSIILTFHASLSVEVKTKHAVCQQAQSPPSVFSVSKFKGTTSPLTNTDIALILESPSVLNKYLGKFHCINNYTRCFFFFFNLLMWNIHHTSECVSCYYRNNNALEIFFPCSWHYCSVVLSSLQIVIVLSGSLSHIVGQRGAEKRA